MNKMQKKLNKYYEEVGIESVKKDTRNGCYDYDKMFRSFRCPKKACCRDACEEAYRKDTGFLFSPRTEGVEVSRCYKKKEYKGHSIPRIVVISLSVPKPEPKPPCPTKESKSCPLNPHWRGTTTTVRSLLCPFVCLAPAGDGEDQSTKIIEQLFVHVRTAKCCSNAGGKSQEPRQLYDNCGCYLRKEVSILEPDVIVTQGNAAHCMSKQYVFDESAKNTTPKEVGYIANSIARIVHLQEGNRKVYWLRSHFPYGSFYSANHAGPAIDCDSDGVENRGGKRRNLVLYGKDIKKFMDMEGR